MRAWKSSLREGHEHVLSQLMNKGFTALFSGLVVTKNLLKSPASGIEPVIHTDASLVEVAELFDSVEFPGSRCFDVQVEHHGRLTRCKIYSRPQSDDYFSVLRKLSEFEPATVFTFLYDAHRDVFLDPWSAYHHLRGRLLVFMPRLKDSITQKPSLLLDIIDLMVNDHFTIDAETEKMLRALVFIPREDDMPSVKRGLGALLTGENPHRTIVALQEKGVLESLFPELVATREVPQDKDHHPEGNVYEHTIECFKHLKRPSLALALGALFHDIGKRETAVFQKRLSFPGHEAAGARAARKILRRIGFEESLIRDVTFLIEHHLLSHVLYHMPERRKAEFMEHRLFPDILRLYKADVMSCFGDLSHYYKISTFYKKIRCHEKDIIDW
ncbi:MAG: HD domain-containing protein [Candidatus Eremiobacteraeota bacterium]|nr:HD domain-containing protein [Candidatus Eremiobacteraeota bacterium]